MTGEYSKYEKKSILARHLQLGKSEQVGRYQWYWRDGCELRLYSMAVNQKLEKAFLTEPKGTIIESICHFEYEIDTSSMQQTNWVTKKVRGD